VCPPPLNSNPSENCEQKRGAPIPIWLSFLSQEEFFTVSMTVVYKVKLIGGILYHFLLEVIHFTPAHNSSST
jgi:hypothetical protein